jgi:ketosteroid isomerase-like protein
MKKLSAFLFVALVAVCLSPALGQDTAADLKTLDAKLTDAFKAREFKLLGKHMAEDYALIDPRGGIHGKTQYLKHLAEGTAKFEELKETDVKVKVFGDTGVVTGLLQVKGKAEGKVVNAEYRWTRVYSKKGGEWLCVLEQHTHVLPKEDKKK